MVKRVLPKLSAKDIVGAPSLKVCPICSEKFLPIYYSFEYGEYICNKCEVKSRTDKKLENKIKIIIKLDQI